MSTVRKKTLFLGALILLAAAVAAALYFKPKPILEPAQNPQIIYISATIGFQGETYDFDIPEEQITDKLKEELLALLLQGSMRNRVFQPNPTYSIDDDSVYLSIHVTQDNGSKHVVLCTNPEYNFVQKRDTYYRIVDHPELYRSVYALLADLLVPSSEAARPWKAPTQ